MAFELPPLPEGVSKHQVRRPPSERFLPSREGDEVEVHYVATWAGNSVELDSSRKRGEPLKLTLGTSDLPFPIMAVLIPALYKGEVAKFTMSQELAFGGVDKIPGSALPSSDVVLELEVAKNPKRQDLFEDGNAIKYEVKEAVGQYEPRSNEEVQICYKVSCDGEVVSASRHVVYQTKSGALGPMGEVVDKALSTMKRGEECTLTCKGKYGLGNEGRFAGKEAKVTLILEQIYEVLDVSLGERDRTVMKKRVVEGEGKSKVRDTARVTLRVDTVHCGMDSCPLQAGLPKEFSFVAGNGEVCDAMECSVLEMRRAETALIRCSKPEMCYGGLLGLESPLQQPVLIKVTLLEFEQVGERWDMSDRQRIEHCRGRKEVAARLFKEGRLLLAANHYQSIAVFFEAADTWKDAEDLREGRELRRIGNLNRAMCMLKLKDWKAARTLCDAVIGEDPENAKAYFRRGTANIELKEYAGAVSDLQRVLDIEPSSAEGKRLLAQAKRLRKDSDKRQSPVFGGMCKAFGQMPERTDRRDDNLVAMPDHLRLNYRPAPAPALEPAPVEEAAVDASGAWTEAPPREAEAEPAPVEPGTGEAPDAGTGEAPDVMAPAD